MNAISSIKKDFIASHIRSQVNTLKAVLESMENSNFLEDDYANESLKRVETNLHQLRKNYRLN